MTQMWALAGATVGIIGFGRIGRDVARRLAAFKCQVLASDPMVAAAEIERSGCTASTLDELISRSDIITLHCPSNAQTRRMIGRAQFSRMKPGVIVVNVARGDLIDTSALIEALQSGRVSAAGLDVTDPEPLAADSPLVRMEQVIITPHIASVSDKAVRALRETVAQTVASALRGEPPPNVVNGVVSSTAAPGSRLP